MLKFNLNNSLVNITRLYVKEGGQLKKIEKLYSVVGSQSKIIYERKRVVGAEGESRFGGTVVFSGLGVLFEDATNVHNFVVPNGVNRVHMVAIGGGGSGSCYTTQGSGGGGGGLIAIANQLVTPGQTLEVNVGLGGSGRTTSADGEIGGCSSVAGYVNASGGKGGESDKGGIGGICSYGNSINCEVQISVATGFCECLFEIR